VFLPVVPASISPNSVPAPILTARDLTVRPGATTGLDRVSFRVPEGVTLAIVGPNGAGKSTLLRVLLHRVPYSDRVGWDGPVRIGYVPQKLVDTDIPPSVEELFPTKGPADYASAPRTVGLAREALSHMTLPGLAAALPKWFIERSTRPVVDAVVGVLFVLALAIGVLLMPDPDLLEALFGNVSQVGVVATLVWIALAIEVVVLTRLIYRSMILAMISGDLAASAGLRMELVSLLCLVLVRPVVAVGVHVVGTLRVGTLVIVPAAAAKTLGTKLTRYATLSSAFGIASALGGTLITPGTGVPAGPLVVVLGVAVFAVASTFAHARERRARALRPGNPRGGRRGAEGSLPP
jgi:ABC-type Mn2+/Zn2+ transport system permease subunit